ncbi:HET-domain-containing protein [Trametes cingulata]|nr:HET-domain-containing protein [Trametes cingulata]
MWLLDTANATLKLFEADQVPAYAILSHVWRDGEQSFQDVKALHTGAAQAGVPDNAGIFPLLSAKIRSFCLFARGVGYKYVWIDTCCIDKSSSAELSEALNSMFSWYANAVMCYAYLDDVRGEEDPRADQSTFRRSRWFTRGWTLQELLAPRGVIFLSRQWQLIGSNLAFADVIEAITGIDQAVLTHQLPLQDVSVARRLSWASRRTTTRIEDRAYSLMGIFNVYMPTVYGEGSHAFTRLQEEILKQLQDQSIFAWGPLLHVDHNEAIRRIRYRLLSPDTYQSRVANEDYRPLQGLLAPSPEHFSHSAHFRPIPTSELSEALSIQVPVPVYHFTSGGLRMHMPCIHDGVDAPAVVNNVAVAISCAVLACSDEHGNLLVLYLRKETTSHDGFSVGFPTETRYLRSALWRRRSAMERSPLSTEIIDVHVMHRAPALFPNQLLADEVLDSSSTFFCIPVWVLARLFSCGFQPLQLSPRDQGASLYVEHDGVSLELQHGGRADENVTASIIFYRSGLTFGTASQEPATSVRISVGLGCGCVPSDSLEDIWIHCDLNVHPPLSSRLGASRHTSANGCTRTHLPRDRPEVQFHRGPFVIRCNVAPWCVYPRRSGSRNIAGREYLLDVTISETPTQDVRTGSAQQPPGGSRHVRIAVPESSSMYFAPLAPPHDIAFEENADLPAPSQVVVTPPTPLWYRSPLNFIPNATPSNLTPLRWSTPAPPLSRPSVEMRHPHITHQAPPFWQGAVAPSTHSVVPPPGDDMYGPSPPVPNTPLIGPSPLGTVTPDGFGSPPIYSGGEESDSHLSNTPFYTPSPSPRIVTPPPSLASPAQYDQSPEYSPRIAVLEAQGDVAQEEEPFDVSMVLRHPRSCCGSWAGLRRHSL